MSGKNPDGNTYVVVLRWIARVWSLLSIGVLLLMFLGESTSLSKITPGELVGLFFFPFLAMVGMAIAWWKEIWGGVITLISFFVGPIAGDFGASAFGPFLIFIGPGFLFLICGLYTKIGSKAVN